MIQSIIQYKDIITIIIAIPGVLLALCFGGFLNWRHKICFEYESRRDVAINILSDAFVQRISSHYSDVASQMMKGSADAKEISRRPEQKRLIRELADNLEDRNRVNRLFSWLDNTSHTAFFSLWGSILLSVLSSHSSLAR